jgi:hypothetical protein
MLKKTTKYAVGGAAAAVVATWLFKGSKMHSKVAG